MIWSDRLVLLPQTLEQLADLQHYYLENAAHLEPWEPARTDDFHTDAAWQDRLEAAVEAREAGHSLKLTVRRRDTDQLIGVCNYTNIVRASFQACHLGYSLAASAQGQGYMNEALTASLHHVFTHLNLHRVMANYVPENTRSGRLLSRLGFVEEGVAKDYLHINGRWRDHVLTSKINPVFRHFTHA